jgi:hypothetical protein
MSIKTKIITCIYDNLYGTEFGGRIGRGYHYRWSLVSLLKMTDADFICYTSESEVDSLSDFFYGQINIDRNKLQIVPYDLNQNYFKEIIEKYRILDEVTKSDRCIPLQYMKLMWYLMEDKSYDYYYWIDAGLSYSGLIPNKYLGMSEGYVEKLFFSELYNNNFLSNLIKFSDEKFTIIGKENQRNYWSGTVNPKHFKIYDSTIHVIGGLFGGKKEMWDLIVELFKNSVNNVTQEDGRLYHEEDFLTLLFRNHSELFNMLHFDTWWHENANIPGLDITEHLKHNKPFYKILEELNI